MSRPPMLQSRVDELEARLHDAEAMMARIGNRLVEVGVPRVVVQRHGVLAGVQFLASQRDQIGAALRNANMVAEAMTQAGARPADAAEPENPAMLDEVAT